MDAECDTLFGLSILLYPNHGESNGGKMKNDMDTGIIHIRDYRDHYFPI